uniref:BED-type domain-containing protein n=1 Tax=Panagrellus redivivus TaxID=6233 RepID=A0A7E4ZRQ5_PANRE
MFTIKRKKNDHPGWNHFDRFDNTIVCKLCEICFVGDGDDYVQGDENELLRHMAELHGDVDFHWMKVAILGPPKTEVEPVTTEREKATEKLNNNEPAAKKIDDGARKESVDGQNVENIDTTIVEENAPTEPSINNVHKDRPPDVDTTANLEEAASTTPNRPQINSSQPSAPDTAPNLDETASSSSTAPPKTPNRPPINPKSGTGPRIAPGTTPNPCYSELLAGCEADLDESWTVVNRYRTYDEYYDAYNSFKVHASKVETICGIIKKVYYCHRRHANSCPYKMHGYLCHDQYGFYEHGKHSHVEEADSPKLPKLRGTPRLLQSVNWDRFDDTVRKTKKCKNGTMTLDDIQKHLPTTCYLKGSYSNLDEMDIARKGLKVTQAENAFTEISAQWMRILYKCEEAGCSYTVYGFCGDAEFGLFDRGYHNCLDEWKTTPKPKRKKRGFTVSACNGAADQPTPPQKHPRPNSRVPDDPVEASTSRIPANDPIPPTTTSTTRDPPEDLPLPVPASSSSSRPSNSVLVHVTSLPKATPTTSCPREVVPTPAPAASSTSEPVNSVMADVTNLPPAAPTTRDPPEDIPLSVPASLSASQPSDSVLADVTNPPKATPTTSCPREVVPTPAPAASSTSEPVNSVVADVTNLPATATTHDPPDVIPLPVPTTPSTSQTANSVLANVTNLPEKPAPKPVEANSAPNKDNSAQASIDPIVYRTVSNVTTEAAIEERTTAEGVRSMGFFPTDDAKQFYRCRQAGCGYKMLSKRVNNSWVLSEMGQHNHPPA